MVKERNLRVLHNYTMIIMGKIRIDVEIDTRLNEKLRWRAIEKFGAKKGYLRKAIEEAIRIWLLVEGEKCILCSHKTGIVKHHITYEPEITVSICGFCHRRLHPKKRTYKRWQKEREEMTYTDWQRLKGEVIRAHNYLCKDCGKHWNEVGSMYVVTKSGLNKPLIPLPVSDLIPLCQSCYWKRKRQSKSS